MGTWQFDIGEPLRGFIVRARSWSKRAKEYIAFKRRVRYIANTVGLPDQIPQGHTASVHIDLSWKKLAHVDLDNFCKALSDSVFEQDRRVGEIHAKRHLNTGEEKAVVTIVITRD